MTDKELLADIIELVRLCSIGSGNPKYYECMVKAGQKPKDELGDELTSCAKTSDTFCGYCCVASGMRLKKKYAKFDKYVCDYLGTHRSVQAYLKDHGKSYAQQ